MSIPENVFLSLNFKYHENDTMYWHRKMKSCKNGAIKTYHVF